MEAIKSRKTNIIVLLLSVAFLFLASCAFGQITRDNLNGKTVTRTITRALQFKNPLMGDDILMSAYSDSIDVKALTFFIFVYFPKNINAEGQNLVVTYTDGTTEVLQQCIYDRNDGYAEYKCIDNINNIAFKKIDSILIRGVNKYKMVNKSYFIDFFAAL